MKWNLSRVLFWWSILASCFLLLTVINRMWPFANPDQPLHRLNIGLAVNVKEFLFAVFAYLLIRMRHIKACIVVVALWVIVKIFYGIAVLVFEPLSGFTVGIFVGQLFMSAILIYFVVLESKTSQAIQSAP